MIVGKNIKYFGGLSPLEIFKNMISFQDIPLLIQNQILINSLITKKEKEFINTKNKQFFNEFKIKYMKNIELSNKLNELITEKKKLKDIIIKLDKKAKKQKKTNNSKINKDFLNNKKIITPYRKRKRRKKIEITNKYFCSFPNCEKGYPSKCSLNMHIKLKHNANNENIV